VPATGGRFAWTKEACVTAVPKIRFVNEIYQDCAVRILECLAALPFEEQVKRLWRYATDQRADDEPIDFIHLCCIVDCNAWRSSFIDKFNQHIADHVRSGDAGQRALGARGQKILIALELGLRFRSEGRPRKEPVAAQAEWITEAECNALFRKHKLRLREAPLTALIKELTFRWHLADPGRVQRLRRAIQDAAGPRKRGRHLHSVLKNWGPDPDFEHRGQSDTGGALGSKTAA
jgi:hypothetical protein